MSVSPPRPGLPAYSHSPDPPPNSARSLSRSIPNRQVPRFLGVCRPQPPLADFPVFFEGPDEHDSGAASSFLLIGCNSGEAPGEVVEGRAAWIQMTILT